MHRLCYNCCNLAEPLVGATVASSLRKCYIIAALVVRLEPNMLKNLPIIPPKIFTYYSYFIPQYYQLFLFYSIVSMILSQYRSDYI